MPVERVHEGMESQIAQPRRLGLVFLVADALLIFIYSRMYYRPDFKN